MQRPGTITACHESIESTTPVLAETDPLEIGTLSLAGRRDWALELGISTPGFAARSVSPGLQSLHLIRRFVRDILREWELSDHADVVVVVVDELVANAIMHALPEAATRKQKPQAWVGLLRKEGAVICAVADPSPRLPVIRDHDPLLEHGRGLQLVAGLSSAWGCSPPDENGKTIWAKVPTPPLLS
ncbi:ATP-binding protein [Streptomyces roseolus]|uniref:ATP-binding protein n=1 Tax=Streptomyces roseolus TaxID=67358 RepID=UPI0036B1B43A